MFHFSPTPGRLPLPTLLTLLLVLLGSRLAQAQCSAPYLYLEKTSQGSVSCNCSSTYRLKASGDYNTSFFKFKLQTNGIFSQVNVNSGADGMTVLISNLTGYASYDVTVINYTGVNGTDCSATTTQTIVIPADLPGGSGGGGGGGGGGPQQEEAYLTGPAPAHPVLDAAGPAPAGQQQLTGITAYPNPASDQLLVPVTPQAVGGTLQLLDATGRVVRQVSVSDAQGVRLDTRELAAGLYQLRVPGARKAQAIRIQH